MYSLAVVTIFAMGVLKGTDFVDEHDKDKFSQDVHLNTEMFDRNGMAIPQKSLLEDHTIFLYYTLLHTMDCTKVVSLHH